MEPIRQVTFDIHGTDPVNKFDREKITIVDKTCPWIIPNGSPYFAEAALTKVYNDAGGLLVLNRDYFFEEEFVPFCKVSGRSICTFLRLSDTILEENAFVKVSYQSIGAWFVPRNDLEQWLELIHNGGVAVPWSKVFRVPPTLPASWHMHNIKTEIGDWFELTWFFVYLRQMQETRGTDPNGTITDAVNAALLRLKNSKISTLALLTGHDQNYTKPHDTTKLDILMGNHDNFATATLEEDLAGTREDLLSTPRGVQEQIKAYTPNTDLIMRSGIMPISRFGGESFIPPNIDGSFEGLGGVACTSGFCLESTGLLMMLTNHNDGRQEGLYYSYVESYNQPNAKVIYSGFKYAPPSLLSIPFNPTGIIAGSNHKAIMVGTLDTSDWYVALTNGTYDPSSHQYVKCDVTDVAKLFHPTNPWNGQARATIHRIGDYLVLIQNYGNQYNDAYAFFRVPVADVQNRLPVKWTQINVSYKDWAGTQFTNLPAMTPFPIARDGNNKITSLGPWTFRQPVTSLTRGGKSLNISCPKPGAVNVGYIQFVIPYVTLMSEPGVNISVTVQGGIGFEFNAATGVLTQINKMPELSIGFTDTTTAEKALYQSMWLGHFYNATAQTQQASTVLLETGELVIASINSSNQFPAQYEIIRYKNRATPSAVLKSRLDVQFGPVDWRRVFDAVVPSPILSGTYPCAMTYDTDGELYGAINQDTNTRKMYLRLVTGGYQLRPEIANLSKSPVLSRPLTNTIYLTNLGHENPVIGITGSAAELTAGGVECGTTSFAACGYSSFNPNNTSTPRNAEFKAPEGHNCLLTFPRTVTRELDQGQRKATYKGATFFGIRQNLVDKFMDMIPVEHRPSKYWCFSMNILGAESGGMFKGLNIGMAFVHFFDAAAATTRIQLVLFRPVVEAPNADHPGVYWIKDITVLDAPGHVRGAINVKMDTANLTLSTSVNQKPIFTAYRDGTRIKAFMSSPYSTETTSTIFTKQAAYFEIDLTALKVENIYGTGVTWSIPDLTAFIPKVGMVDTSLNGIYPNATSITWGAGSPHLDTGGAAALYRKTSEVDGSVTYYMGATAYPETGWTVFFQDNIGMLVNGTVYRMTGGSVDLRDIDPAPQNKTFYIYATVEGDDPRYLFSTTKLRKSGNLLLAATLVTNSLQILTITRHQPLMLGQYALSYTREGGTIPMSAGFPQDEGDFFFLKSSELLP